jgi:hypothetical protein
MVNNFLMHLLSVKAVVPPERRNQKFTSRIVEGLTLLRGLVERGMEI